MVVIEKYSLLRGAAASAGTAAGTGAEEVAYAVAAGTTVAAAGPGWGPHPFLPSPNSGSRVPASPSGIAGNS